MLRGGGRSRKTSDEALCEEEEGDESATESLDGDSLPNATLGSSSFHPEIRFVSHVEADLDLPSPEGHPIKQELGPQYQLHDFPSFQDHPEYHSLRQPSPGLVRLRDRPEHGDNSNPSFGSGDTIDILSEASRHEGMFPPMQTDLTNWSMPPSTVPIHYAVSPSQPGPSIPAEYNHMLYPANRCPPPLRENAHPDGFYSYSPDFGHFPTGFTDGIGDEQRHQLQAGHDLSMHCHTPLGGLPGQAHGHAHGHAPEQELHLESHVRRLAGV